MADAATGRRAAWAWVLTAGLLALYLVSCNATMFGQYVDDMNWLLAAEAMLKGSLLRAWHHPPQLELSLNWGVPILLMPFLALFGRCVLLLKVFMAGLFFSGLYLFYLATKDRFPGRQRYAYASILFLADFMLTFAGNIMGEPGYVFLLGLVVYLLFERGWFETDDARRWAGIGAMSGFIVLMRSIGFVAPIALFLELALTRRWRAARWFALGAAASVLPFTLYLVVHLGQVTFYASYWALRMQGGLAMALAGVLQNAHLYLKGLSCLTAVYLPTLAAPVGALEWAAMSAVLAASAAGMALGRRSALHRVLAYYAVGHFLVCAGYVYQAPRYVVPLYPVFVFLCFEGLRRFLPERFHARALAALAAFALLTNLPGLAGTVRTSLAQPTIVPHESYDWLRGRASPEDRVVSMDMMRIHYFTGLKGLLIIPSADLSGFVEGARAMNASWFVVREAGFIPPAKGVTDPTRTFYDRLNGYLGRREFFERVYRNEAEQVSIFVLREARR
ncbi:MAG: glycosyltransferase family 39 protein [Elusimicrobia bacterium]|nr:glycosyltransferase family 39 protein [Elusimicrobiota bacterium]